MNLNIGVLCLLENKKVLLVANYTWNIWAFRQELVKELLKNKAYVYVVAGKDDYTEEVRRLGVELVSLQGPLNTVNPFREILNIKYLFSAYMDIRPDIVHHYTIKPNMYGPFLARWSGAKVVVNMVTGLGSIFIGNSLIRRLTSGLVKRIYKKSFKRSDLIYFANQEDREEFIKASIVSREKSCFIFGAGVDLARFCPYSNEEKSKAKSALGFSKGEKIILFVGRMTEEKGLLELAKAIKLISDESVRLVLVGPEYPNPRAITPGEIVSYDSRILYFGEVKEMLRYYGAADVVVLPSYREGMPTVLLEAAAMGVPAVTTDVPGCRDAVLHGVTGWVVPPKNPSSLADSLVSILNDKNKCEYLGNNARERSELFDKKRIVTRIINDYSSLTH